MKPASVVFFGVALTALAACGSTPEPVPTEPASGTLRKFVADNSYEPFAVPRSDLGPGTVLSVVNGVESIKAFNDECFRLSRMDPATGGAQPNTYREVDVTLDQNEYGVNRVTKLEASLAREAVREVELEGAFEDTRVKNVVVRTGDAKEQITSELTMDRRLAELVASQDEACLRKIFADGNYVIDRVLLVGSLKVEFRDERGNAIGFDAGLLDALSIEGNNRVNLQGLSALTATTPRMIGYRLYKFEAEGGFGAGRISKTRVNMDAVMGRN
jgi:hypothetical protein